MDNKTFIDTLVISGRLNIEDSKKIKEGNVNLKEVYEKFIKIGCTLQQITILYTIFNSHELKDEDIIWFNGYLAFLFNLFRDKYNRDNIVNVMETTFYDIFEVKHGKIEDFNGDIYIAPYGEIITINKEEFKIIEVTDFTDHIKLVDSNNKVRYSYVLAIGIDENNNIKIYSEYANIRKESKYRLYFDRRGYYEE